MNEKDLQNYLRNGCIRAGILFYKTECVGKRGFPDCTLIDNGQVIFVELKSPAGTGRLSKLQERTIQQMRAAGARVEVIDSVKGVNNLIRELTS